MIKSYKNDDEELKHYISYIKKSTCPFHFTSYNLSDHVLIISKILRELQKIIKFHVIKDILIEYLGNWQYEIVKDVIESNIMNGAPYMIMRGDKMFNFGSLFHRINIYIHCYICLKDDKWLEKNIIELYSKLDIKSIEILYQYYILSYLSFDHVYLMDMCSIGFNGIKQMIRKKCNQCVINHSYELQMILSNYVDIPSDNYLFIEEHYRLSFLKYLEKITPIIDSEELFKTKEQSKRFKYLINNILRNYKNNIELKRFNSYKVWFYFLKFVFMKKESIFINYKSNVCYFLSRFNIRNDYVKKQLCKYDLCLIKAYIELINTLINILNDKNYEKITNIIILFENYIISGISSVSLACTIVKYANDIYTI